MRSREANGLSRAGMPWSCGARRLAWLGMVTMAAASMPAQGQVQITEAQYRDRLKGMWLAECIANWTGIRTEGARWEPPFLTDANWGQPLGFGVVDYWIRDPWWADDDTDIEYVYVHLMNQHQMLLLSPEQVRDGWRRHINTYIWVSNQSARQLMERGCTPPSTSLSVANFNRLMIDAQLTTEMFGAVAPGSPALALQLADLPIAATASGYAGHAAQFFAALYALAPHVPQELSGRDQSIWLVQQARAFIPATSKTGDIADFVLADFLANPDVNDWERTRDAIYQRYQGSAAANGFIYRAWYESSVNFATGIMALLYGQGDLKRTIQVGTLSGWDSDNGTATMGGLLGLMRGEAWVRAAFPTITLSETYWIARTRDNLPDYVPAQAGWDDTFSMIADRMIPLARAGVLASGGTVNGDVWTLPDLAPAGARLAQNPRWRDAQRSARRRIMAQGGTVTPASSVVSQTPSWRGSTDPAFISNGLESEGAGVEQPDAWLKYYSTQRTTPNPSDVWLSVTFGQPVTAAGVRFVEGNHFQDAPVGGWFAGPVVVELQIQGTWTAVAGQFSEPMSDGVPFQVLDWMLPQAVVCTGVRVRGAPGGAGGFVTCAELDVLEPLGTTTGWDPMPDGRLNVQDLQVWEASPTDVDGDGATDPEDRACLRALLRMGERRSLVSGR